MGIDQHALDDMNRGALAQPTMELMQKLTPLHLGHYFVLWNCRRPPFDDPRVRRALGLLFDRDAICREVFGGQATVAKGYFRPGSPEYPDRLEAPRFAWYATLGVGFASGAPTHAPRALEALTLARSGLTRGSISRPAQSSG